jgi:hypothetical protein
MQTKSSSLVQQTLTMLKANSTWIYLLFCILAFSSCSKHGPELIPAELKPQILSISPTSASAGQTITVRGHNLLGGSTSVKITVNKVNAEIVSATDEEINAKVPARAGSGAVSIVVGDETFEGPTLTYTYDVMVSTIAGSGDEGTSDGNGAAASFKAPWGMTMDNSTGDIYIADSYNRLIRKIDGGTDHVSTISIPPTINGSYFFSPYNITIDQDTKSLYVTDFNDHVLKRTADGELSVIITDAMPLAGIALSPEKKLFIGNNTTGQIFRFDTTGANKAGVFTGLVTPRNIFFDTSGTMFAAGYGLYKFSSTSYQQLMPDPTVFGGWEMVKDELSGGFYMADHFKNKIFKMEPDGSITTIAGNGDNADVDGPGATASFNGPMGLIIDQQGNLFVTTYNFDTRGGNKVRKVTIH